MNASRLGLRSIVAVSSVIALVACSATGTHQFTGAGGGDTGTGASSAVGTGAAAATSTGALTTTNSSTATGISSTTSGGTGGMAVSSAYLHTATSLYTFDPSNPSTAPVYVGDFDCLGSGSGQDYSMTDLAVNSTGELWAISSHYVYPIQISGSTVHCVDSYALNAPSGVVFYGLTFAPAGVLGSGEVLVGANTAGQLYSIEQNGNGITLTQRGTFGTVPQNDGHGHNYPSDSSTGNTVGSAWELSGDIVFLANNGNPLGFATVRDCKSPPSTSNCSNTDTLIEINVGMLATATTQSVTQSVRGQVVKSASCTDTSHTSYGGMYGIAASGSSVFGLAHGTSSAGGSIVQIDNNDGSACLVQSSPSQQWDGAAITTVAQVMPPTVN